MKNNSVFIRAKIFLVAFFVILTYFFSNDFGLIDIEKTAIVTAITVDKENDEYEITMQIAVPEATTESSDNEQTLVTGKGRTVGEAIGNVGSLTGWFPKLSFCNLILLGENVYKENISASAEYFIRSVRVQDSALIAATEGKASDIIKNATPLDNVSSFAIQKVLLRKTGIDGAVLKTDIKDFLKNFYSRSRTAYLPLISVESDENTKNSGNSGQGSGSGSSSQGSGESQGPEEGKKLFTATRTVVIKGEKTVGILTPSETNAAVFFKQAIFDSSLPVSDVEINGKSENFLLRIIRSESKKKITLSGETVSVKVYQNVSVKTADQTIKFGSDEYLPFFTVLKSASEKAERDLKAEMLGFLNVCKTLNADLIGVDDAIYRYHHDKYDLLKDRLFENINFDVSVNVYGQK